MNSTLASRAAIPFAGPLLYGGEKDAASNNRPDLTGLDAIERIRWAHKEFGDGLVLTSSFGVQSVVMIELMRRSGIDIPVVAIEFTDKRYDQQRAYRGLLERHYRLKLRTTLASGENHKVEALNWTLKTLKATAWIDGIRRSQTQNRNGKEFTETMPDGFVHIHPILDWGDGKTANFIEGLDSLVIHPAYALGALSKGGRVLKPGEGKTECGIHVNGNVLREPEYYI